MCTVISGTKNVGRLGLRVINNQGTSITYKHKKKKNTKSYVYTTYFYLL